MAEFHFRFLGAPRITRDGEELRITRRKSIALLAYLAVSDLKQSRGKIIALLWPEQDESHGRGSLRTALSSVNSELGEPVVSADGDFVILDPGIRVDVRDFRRKASEIKKNEIFNSRVVQQIKDAAELYGGAFLDGFAIGKGQIEFEDWQFNQEANLRTSFSRILERIVQAETLASSFDTAIRYAERWIGHEPENEHAHRRLIELYAWTDKRREALHQYELCRSYLERELGVEPDDATVRLYESVRDNRLSVPATVREGREIPTDPVAGNSVYYSTILSVGLTNSAERLMEQRPYDTASIVNILFHKSIEDILKKHSVDAWLFTGDTLVALFGVPNATHDDAYRAVIASLETLQVCARYGFTMTAGVATGLVYFRTDEDSRQNVSLIGPAVTQASLLRFFGDPGMIFVEDATRDRTRDSMAFEKTTRAYPGMGRTQDVYRLLTGDSPAAGIVG